MGCILDKSGTDKAECSRKLASGRKVAGVILVNTGDLHLQYARVLHKTLLVRFLMYGSEAMIWKEKERSRIRAIQMHSNAWIRELRGVTKGWTKGLMKGVFQRFRHVERMENDKIAKKVYVGEWVGSRSVDRSQKRWIDTMKDCLKKRSLDIRQARRMVHDRSEWWGFVRGNAWCVAQGMNP